jgi:hypothetical protein
MEEIKLIDYPDIIDYGQGYYRINYNKKINDIIHGEKFWKEYLKSTQPKRIKVNAFD